MITIRQVFDENEIFSPSWNIAIGLAVARLAGVPVTFPTAEDAALELLQKKTGHPDLDSLTPEERFPSSLAGWLCL